MQHLRLDIARLYKEREELFIQRWSLSTALYSERLTELNVRIYGYETLLCRHFRESLIAIFLPTEAYGG